MPAGIQCWDATGKLIVDIGDYNTRYLGQTTITLALNVIQASGSFPGLTQNGSFGVVSAYSSNNYYLNNNFFIRTIDGGFTVFRVTPTITAVTLTIDLYAFL